MIVDSHCHLSYEPMYSSLKEVLSRAKTNNVDYLLTISTEDAAIGLVYTGATYGWKLIENF